MNRYLLSTLITLLFFQVTEAQQLPLFAQYRNCVAVLNPAAALSDYLIYGYKGSAGASVRSQWVGKDGAPQTQLIQGSYIMEQRERTVSPIFGGHIMHDKAGRVGTIGAYGRIGGVLSADPAYNGIAAGLTVGIVQYRIDLNGIVARDQDDDLLADQDLHQRIYPDVGVGLYAWQQTSEEDVLFGGISVPQTLGLDVTFRNASNKKFNINRVQHVYGLVGWKHGLATEGSMLELNAWLKYVPNAPFHFDANARYQIGENFWLGAGYGMSKAIHLETGLLFELNDQQLRIGYSFDFNANNQILAFGQSHEVNVAVGFAGSGAWR